MGSAICFGLICVQSILTALSSDMAQVVNNDDGPIGSGFAICNKKVWLLGAYEFVVGGDLELAAGQHDGLTHDVHDVRSCIHVH
jgi:hypothetical protein